MSLFFLVTVTGRIDHMYYQPVQIMMFQVFWVQKIKELRLCISLTLWQISPLRLADSDTTVKGLWWRALTVSFSIQCHYSVMVYISLSICTSWPKQWSFFVQCHLHDFTVFWRRFIIDVRPIATWSEPTRWVWWHWFFTLTGAVIATVMMMMMVRWVMVVMMMMEDWVGHCLLKAVQCRQAVRSVQR